MQKDIVRLLCEYQSEGYSYPHLCVAGTDTLQGATTLRVPAFRIMPLSIMTLHQFHQFHQFHQLTIIMSRVL
jgi:hypothetical protein